MATEWFVQRDGEPTGPFTSEQILTMWLSHRLTPHDPIRRQDSQQWVAAGTVRGLLPPTPLADASTAGAMVTSTKRNKSYLPTFTVLAALCVAVYMALQVASPTSHNLRKEQPDEAQRATVEPNAQQDTAKKGKAPELVPELQALCADAEEVLILDPTRIGFAKPVNGDVFSSFPDASLPTTEEKPSPRRQMLVVLKTGPHGKLFVQTDGMGIIELADLDVTQEYVASNDGTKTKTPLVLFGSKAHGPPHSLVTRSYRLVLHTNNEAISVVDDLVQSRFQDLSNGTWSKSDGLSRWEGPVYVHKQRVPANGQAKAIGSGAAKQGDQAGSQAMMRSTEEPPAIPYQTTFDSSGESGERSDGLSSSEMAGKGHATRPSAPQLSERTGSGEIGGVVESGNVARASNGTTVSKIWANQNALLDGVYEGEPAHDGLGKSWTVTFAKTYSLSRIRLKLWDRPNRFYTYKIEASEDGINFDPLIDRSTGAHKGWQELDFPAQPIRALRVTGLSDTKKVGFHVHELEAYCTP